MTNKSGNLNAAYNNYADNETSFNKHNSEKSNDIEGGKKVDESPADERPTWTNKTHFLMSCIQMSVGLGNIWRFPFVAYENGGGAFLIPYLIILFIVGKPMYYLEMFMGQFMGRTAIKAWAINPALRGIGVGSLVSSLTVGTYYSSLIALTIYYFFASFASTLPWSVCREDWGSNCVDALPKSLLGETDISENVTTFSSTHNVSSSELYFLREVLHETLDISTGIGWPSWRLSLCLLGSWTIVFFVICRGIKSSGKASYFLALFPYVIMFALFLRAVTLEGSGEGIMYFLTPQWGELLNPKIWYAATNQAFFSLGLGMGPILSFASYNEFHYDFYKDALIVTSLDTLTSLIAGITIFGILGNLAHNLGLEDIKDVVKSGTGLAFISYPDAISKFDFFPAGFSVLFFFMLFILGVGSVVGTQNNLVSIICDQFKCLKFTVAAALLCLFCFLGGLVYLTPGGQWMVVLMDTFGGTMMIFFLAIFEMVGIIWIYGLENVCLDLEFATGRKASFYWRLCWGILCPFTLIFVFCYQMMTFPPLRYSGLEFPIEYVAFGWSVLFIGAIQVPIWFIYAYSLSLKRTSALHALLDAFKPSEKWGPRNAQNRIEWLKFREEAKKKIRVAAANANHSPLRRRIYGAFGLY